MISLGSLEVATIPADYHADIQQAGLKLTGLDQCKAGITLAYLERASRRLDSDGHVAAVAVGHLLEVGRRWPEEYWRVMWR